MTLQRLYILPPSLSPTGLVTVGSFDGAFAQTQTPHRNFFIHLDIAFGSMFGTLPLYNGGYPNREALPAHYAGAVVKQSQIERVVSFAGHKLQTIQIEHISNVLVGITLQTARSLGIVLPIPEETQDTVVLLSQGVACEEVIALFQTVSAKTLETWRVAALYAALDKKQAVIGSQIDLLA
jgi:hypothetical protein